MCNLGVNYDTGLVFEGRSTRRSFDEDVARRELEIIARDLGATAVRISGSDLDRLSAAARLAAGLEVWFAPVVHGLEPDELVAFLTEAARRAAALPGDPVLVLGCEISLFCNGFVPGDGLAGRVATMSGPAAWSDPATFAELAAGLAKFKATQREIAEAARKVFPGRITYAAGMWEDVDWELFDLVSIDAYRDAANAGNFAEQVRAYRRFGKPVAVTEFGCCTYRGAAERGGSGWLIVDERRTRVTGEYQRDEQEQVTYLRELLDVFEAEGVDSAFWFSFAGFELPRREDPERDLDLSAYGLVAVLENAYGTTYPDMRWEPKAVFAEFARRTSRKNERTSST
ncbi:hypothetical protein [Amycolatopsis sp.]|uniref:hypothetical protein n=1 Tax=Amycolatopsis sp. TaxID=37632 RepID=UPI002CBBCE0D|nr:hypothetical protein [Amycolatopsis sp.]HVV12966.1 hypothetical protein [Amycolatopsis sp.]